MDPSWIERRQPGDIIQFVDARGSRRELRVIAKGPGRCEVEVWDTTYFETGTELSCDGDNTHVGELPSLPQSISCVPETSSC